jgi:hypothetical protein
MEQLPNWLTAAVAAAGMTAYADDLYPKASAEQALQDVNPEAIPPLH